MLATMRSFFILALFCMVGWSNSQRWSNSQTCPARYKRFTLQHSFCLPPNPSCQITRTGVSPQDKNLILQLHNQFRSKVAMGQEHGGKNGDWMPQAADMMQMEWDDELAAVAQKWTQNCYWGHDCNECREVENFPVGQNLANMYTQIPCYSNNCPELGKVPDWTEALTRLYNEVKDYPKRWLLKHQKHPEPPKTGHFTQLIWSKSWRVGCGYSYYKLEGIYYKYYACNYGPGGNVEDKPVYKQGTPCSACPTNTQCSVSPRGANSFPGLCKMNNPNTAPAYRINQQGLLFYCGGSDTDSDCKFDVSGSGSLEAVNSVGGNYYSIEVSGGQSATLTFRKSIIPNGQNFCLYLLFRKGPLDASRGDVSSFKANYKMDYSFARPMELDTGTTSFMGYSIDLGWGTKTKLSFTFSAPRGAGKHVLELRKIIAYDGDCGSRNI